MASPREIKKQAAGIKKIQKITDAMQKVAVSKMQRAQQHMKTSMPYANKICEVVGHVAASHPDYRDPFLQEHKHLKRVGYIVVSSDRGLCGSLNNNLFRQVVEHAEQFKKQNIEVEWCLFGDKARGFFNSFAYKVVAQACNLGETPQMANLVGCIKVMLDGYRNEILDRLFIASNEFINTMTQRPKITQLLPIKMLNTETSKHKWDYIYEPRPEPLLNYLMVRYIETQVYQAVVANVACEQVARMLAMKNAARNAKELIDALQLMYNKARQAAITQEITEIIAGAEAV